MPVLVAEYTCDRCRLLSNNGLESLPWGTLSASEFTQLGNMELLQGNSLTCIPPDAYKDSGPFKSFPLCKVTWNNILTSVLLVLQKILSDTGCVQTQCSAGTYLDRLDASSCSTVSLKQYQYSKDILLPEPAEGSQLCTPACCSAPFLFRLVLCHLWWLIVFYNV